MALPFFFTMNHVGQMVGCKNVDIEKYLILYLYGLSW